MADAADRFVPDAPCICCGVNGHGTTDHQRPQSMGGTDEDANRAVACWRCNQIKSVLERQFAARYRRALTDERREALAAMLARQWRRYCSERRHGRDRACRCGDCLRAPIVFGVPLANAAGRTS